MASYLLLRNNKESGPYTLEALIQLGLKPYDLVWVEGRSAAWRYPSEVEGLKFYAPAVEEQPFDRFYKKPSEQKKEEEKQKPLVQETAQQVLTETPTQKIQETFIQEEKVEINIPKKQVYVSMPANGGKTVIIKKTEQVTAKAASGSGSLNDGYSNSQESFTKPETVINSSSPSYSELVSDYNKQQYTEKKVPAQQIELPVDDYPMEKKYSQSLDDIKDKYVQTLAERKRKNAQKKVIMNIAKKVVPFAAVLLIGILTGVFIMNKKSGKETLTQSQQNLTPVKPDAANMKQDLNSNNNNAAQQQVPTESQTGPTQQQAAENKPVEANTTDLSKSTIDPQTGLVTAVNTKKNTKKESKVTNAAGNSSTELAQPKSIEPDPVTVERNKVVRSDNDNTTQAAAKQFSSSLMKQVSVASNDYKRGTFGGIHDLQLTVTNNSNYLLDNVVVELQILKPNEQPLKTDNVRFSPVPPNGSLTLAIPATSRGVKVAYKVVHVESKSAVNDTAGLK